jgi:proteasome lid subunit RPN8/RPN11
MVADDFTFKSREITYPPFRPRSFFPGFDVFKATPGIVLISPDTVKRLQEEAATAHPREAGGLLAGRVFRDADGPFTAVLDVVVAKDAGQQGRIEMSPELTYELRRECARRFPGSDVVGWWHSHSAVSEYSKKDMKTQKIFSDPNHVGLLVFAQPPDETWALAYLGPDAQLIIRDSTSPPTDARAASGSQPREPTTTSKHSEETQSEQKSARPSPIKWWRKPPQLKLHWRTVFAVIAILPLAVVGAIFPRPAEPGAQGTSATFSWFCQLNANGRVVCDANANVGGSIWWKVDNAPVPGQNTIAFDLGERTSVLVTVTFALMGNSYTDSQRLVR